ncbi:MAG: hypothetical protein BAA02_05480 [Paenibacillaceae bacterium ZCTH02-B3]|nr:MAG: hypothetical protein BAA02_05480 [Paenibacillaceae bacterium ZCTH02-B3]
MPLERRKQILDLIYKKGVIKTVELAKHFDVNIATIRRDLKILAREHPGIQISYGGASLRKGQTYQREQPMTEKLTQNVEQKMQIAQKAARLIEDGDIIALNCGSTVSLILDYLDPGIRKLTVITLGFNIAEKAVRLPFVELIMPGGTYRHSSQVFWGRNAEMFLEDLVIDKAFFGAVAVDRVYGWTHSVLSEVEMNRIMFKNSRKRYLVADSSKYDKVSLGKVSDLCDFDAWIVDDGLPGQYVEYAEAHGIQII